MDSGQTSLLHLTSTRSRSLGTSRGFLCLSASESKQIWVSLSWFSDLPVIGCEFYSFVYNQYLAPHLKDTGGAQLKDNRKKYILVGRRCESLSQEILSDLDCVIG